MQTPCNKEKWKIAICPQFAVAFSSDIQRRREGPPQATGPAGLPARARQDSRREGGLGSSGGFGEGRSEPLGHGLE